MRILFLLSFFLLHKLSANVDIVESALALKIYEKNEWKALLHYEDSYHTTDKKFILSSDKTPQQELITTIQQFHIDQNSLNNPDQHPQCRFPARKLFIEKELGRYDLFPKVSCPDLDQYRQKAPAEQISLIYVSENVKHPTSMMGHSFFKLDGTTNGVAVSHAASFFTIVDSINIFKVIYENLYAGMKGQFSLRPYQESIQEYMDEERNVWEYQLKLDNYRKDLIYYHIWELKDVNLNYFFASYNCSTVVYFSLCLAKPGLYQDYTFWLSPLQTAKLLYKYQLIEQTQLHPSNEWLLRMAHQQLSSKQIKKIVQFTEQKNYKKFNTLNYLELQFLIAYTNNLYKENKLKTKEFIEFHRYINGNLEDIDKVLDISAYKSPKYIPNERQVKIAYASYDDTKFVKLGFLPASHLLNDDNREYFTESSLKVLEFSLIANKEDIYLDQLNIYEMKSYIPFEKYTQNLSYEFAISVDREPNRLMEYQYTTKIDGGFGIDFQLLNDIHLFGMLNLGIAYDKLDKTYFNAEPYIGFMIYEIWDMKTLANYTQRVINKQRAYEIFNLDHNIFINKSWKINALYKHYKSFQRNKTDSDQLEFSLNYMF
jgi:hypothetical protein